MSTVPVVYALGLSGNLEQAAPKVAADLDKVSDAADDAKAKVQDLDKAGAGFSARAIEMGSATLEMAGAVFEGVKAFLEGAAAAKEWMDSVVELREGLIDQGRATKEATQGIEEYAEASKRLNTALEDLQLTMGEELAPAFTDAINAGTGLLRLLDDMGDKASNIAPDFDTLVSGLNALSPTAAALLSSAGAVGSTLAVLGQSPDVPFAPNQGLVLPISPTSTPTGAGGSRVVSDAQFGFGIPGTVEELEAQFFGDLFEQWLRAPAEQLELAAAEMEVSAGRVGVSAEQMIAGLSTGVSALGTGSVAGVVGMAGADPITTLVMEVIGLLRDPQPLFDLFSEVLETYMDLDSWIGDLTTELIDQVVANIDEIAAAFVVIGPAVALALVEAAPLLFAELIQALYELPATMARHLAGLIAQAGDALNPFNDGIDINNPFARGGALATHFGPGSDSFLGIGLSSLDTGGVLRTDGIYMGHAGEVVLNREQQRAMGGTSIGAIHVHMHGVSDMRRFTEELQNALGSYGLNISLSPRVG